MKKIKKNFYQGITIKVLLTGASGFAGQHALKIFKQKGLEVFSLGRKAIQGITHYSLNDCSDESTIFKAISEVKPNFLFHFAGTSTNHDLLEATKINVYFGATLLSALEKAKLDLITKVLFLGSAAEYGLVASHDLPLSEKYAPKPLNYYGISKFAQNLMALKWSQTKGRKLVVARPFTMIGQGMPEHLAIGSFANQIKKIKSSGGKGQIQTGDLTTKRDFIDVDDAIELFWRIINNEKAYGQIVNVCLGKPTEIREILNYLIEKSGLDIQLVQSNDRMRANDMPLNYGDNSTMLNLVGDFKFKPWQQSVSEML